MDQMNCIFVLLGWVVCFKLIISDLLPVPLTFKNANSQANKEFLFCQK